MLLKVGVLNGVVVSGCVTGLLRILVVPRRHMFTRLTVLRWLVEHTSAKRDVGRVRRLTDCLRRGDVMFKHMVQAAVFVKITYPLSRRCLRVCSGAAGTAVGKLDYRADRVRSAPGPRPLSVVSPSGISSATRSPAAARTTTSSAATPFRRTARRGHSPRRHRGTPPSRTRNRGAWPAPPDPPKSHPRERGSAGSAAGGRAATVPGRRHGHLQ
eukprot:gene8431-biopygen15163